MNSATGSLLGVQSLGRHCSQTFIREWRGQASCVVHPVVPPRNEADDGRQDDQQAAEDQQVPDASDEPSQPPKPHPIDHLI